MEHMSTKEKLKNMTRKQKIEYIWEYYKVHIIGTIILVAIITSFIVEMSRSKEMVFNMTMLGQFVDTDKLEALQNKATSELVNDPKNKQEIRFDFLMKSPNGADQYTAASLQKLQASIAVRDIDILIVDKNDFKIYADQGTFMKLSGIPEISQLGLTDNDFVKHQIKDSDSKEEIYGISVDSISILKDIKFDTTNKVLCIVSNTKRSDKVSTFLKWLYLQKSS